MKAFSLTFSDSLRKNSSYSKRFSGRIINSSNPSGVRSQANSKILRQQQYSERTPLKSGLFPVVETIPIASTSGNKLKAILTIDEFPEYLTNRELIHRTKFPKLNELKREKAVSQFRLRDDKDLSELRKKPSNNTMSYLKYGKREAKRQVAATRLDLVLEETHESAISRGFRGNEIKLTLKSTHGRSLFHLRESIKNQLPLQRNLSPNYK